MGGGEEEKNHVQAQVLDEQGMSSAFLTRTDRLMRLPVQGQVPHTNAHPDKDFTSVIGHSAHIVPQALYSLSLVKCLIEPERNKHLKHLT